MGNVGFLTPSAGLVQSDDGHDDQWPLPGYDERGDIAGCHEDRHETFLLVPEAGLADYAGTPVSLSSGQDGIMARPAPSRRVSNTECLFGTVIPGTGGQRDKLLNPLITDNNICP